MCWSNCWWLLLKSITSWTGKIKTLCFGAWERIVQILVWQNLRAGFPMESILMFIWCFAIDLIQLFVIMQVFLVSYSKNILTDVLRGQSEKSQLQLFWGASFASSRSLTTEGILFSFSISEHGKDNFLWKTEWIGLENIYPDTWNRIFKSVCDFIMLILGNSFGFAQKFTWPEIRWQFSLDYLLLIAHC